MKPRTHEPVVQNVEGKKVVVAQSIGTLIMQADSAAPPRPAALSNLPPLSPTFIPRENVTKQIHEALNAGGHTGAIKQAAARAHGGFGKTVAAILYAHQYAAHYPGGRFFLSMEKGDIATALASLGGFFGVPDDAKPDAAAPLVKQGLENAVDAEGKPGAALLVLDNIVDAAQWETIVKTGLVPRGGCRVLITTRAENIPQAKIVRVGRLTNEEARDIYKCFCTLADVRGGAGREAPSNSTADAITALVGGLAVAVAAVAARMKLRPDVAWADYAAMLAGLPIGKLPDASEEVRREIGTDGKALAEHRRTLGIIDDALDALPAPERRAVEYAALLPADMAPLPWLIWLLEQDAARPDTNEHGAPDPLRITLIQEADIPGSPALRVIKHLDTLDLLLEKAEGGNFLSLHRLWHARVREHLAARFSHEQALRAAIGACAMDRYEVVVGLDQNGEDRGVEDPAALTDQSLRWELSPLAIVCAELWAKGEPGIAAGVGVWLASVLKDLGRLSEAAACLLPVSMNEAAVEAAIGHEDVAACYSNLGAIQENMDDLGAARASIERAIAIARQHVPKDDATFVADYCTLAMILYGLGEFVSAFATIAAAMEINSKHFPENDVSFATIYSNRSLIQAALGDLHDARTSIERAIDIEKNHYAEDHPNLASGYFNLATIQKDLGDLTGAKESTERTIAIERKHFGDNHPTLATSYSHLAIVLRDQGELRRARESIERSIAIKLKHFAEDHHSLAKRFSILGSIDLAEGKRAEACNSFRRALQILLKNFGEAHPQVESVRTSMKAAGCGQ